jgi:4-aminobutyrate aminotransferase
VAEAARRGLLLIAPIGLHGNVLRLAPPLIITREQIEQALTILAEVCRAVEAPVLVGV